MSVEEHRRQIPAQGSLRVAIVTVSDTRTEATDEGGRLVRELCEAAGVTVASARIVRDEPASVVAAVDALLRDAGLPEGSPLGAILLTGGTGIAARDTTVEALAARLDKTLSGFGELFRMLSFAEIGAAAMLSRATAGVMGKVAVFLMPGSPKAVRLAMSRLILPELGHVVAQLAGGAPGSPAPGSIDGGAARHHEHSGRPSHRG